MRVFGIYVKKRKTLCGYSIEVIFAGSGMGIVLNEGNFGNFGFLRGARYVSRFFININLS